MALETPILFLIFNRPDTTTLVFEQIKKVRPTHLYVAADGPRKGNLSDEIKCVNTRKVIDGVAWDCEVKTLFRDENLGCGKAVSQAINWFFEHVEEGIILEDDTLPDISFFEYCQSLLNEYRNNESVMHISGCYFLKKYEVLAKSSPGYFFTKHIHVWGWATWRRAWKHYDFSRKNIADQKNNLEKYYGSYANFWNEIYSQVFDGKIDTWDYQWMYAIFSQKGIAINPTHNLVQNIGFNEEATHTKDVNSKYKSIETEPFSKIRHPPKIKVDQRRDDLYYKEYLLAKHSNKSRLKRGISSLFNKISGTTKTGIDAKVPGSELQRLSQLPRYEVNETIFLGKKFRIVDASTFLSSVNEIFESEIYKFNASSNAPIVIDCGANIGLATIYFKVNYPQAKVFAYEPDPDIFEALKTNIESFGFENVSIFNEAIGEKNETLLFKKEGGHSGMLVSAESDKTVPVRVAPLKEILAKFDVIDFLKIDIEGHEINVMPSIADELKKVQVLFLEYHTFIDEPQRLSEIMKIIENAGFRYYIKEAACKKNPFLERELFYKMDMLVNIFCYR